MVRVGHDPCAGVTLWQKIVNTSGGSQPPTFPSSHPTDIGYPASLKADHRLISRVMRVNAQKILRSKGTIGMTALGSTSTRTILKRTEMNTQASKHMHVHVPLLITAIAAIMLSIVAIAIVPVIGWFHGSFEGFDRIFTHEQLPETPAAPIWVDASRAGHAQVKARCDECGIVESMRQFAPEENSPAIYEITVRMRDGSTRVLSDTNPANWRPGERIVVIGGGKQSGR